MNPELLHKLEVAIAVVLATSLPLALLSWVTLAMLPLTPSGFRKACALMWTGIAVTALDAIAFVILVILY